MGSLGPGRGQGNNYYPTTRYYDIAASQTIVAGDLVVLSGASSTTRVRKLTSTDISNNYTESTVVKGILGISLADAKTDTNGVALSPITPSYVNAGDRAIYPVPNYAASLKTDPVSGTSKLPIAIFDDLFEFFALYQGASNAAATVTPAVRDSLVGFQIYNTSDFAINSGASGAGLCAIVTDVNEMDPNYNTSS